MLFTPEHFVARLAALIPRPGKNLVRYHGLLAPNARARAEIEASATPHGDDGGEPPTGTGRARAAQSPNRPVPPVA